MINIIINNHNIYVEFLSELNFQKISGTLFHYFT